jgi:glycine/D-amino acid oxidase-like deaminating enzyme
MDALERAVTTTPAIRRIAAEVLSIDPDQPSALTPTRGPILRYAARSGNGGLGRQPPWPATPAPDSTGARTVCSGWRGLRFGTSPTGAAATSSLGAIRSSSARRARRRAFENETSLGGLSALRSIATRAIPALANALVVDHWAGLRPMSLDTHPILGADPESPALVYACGYSRNGILFAPWAAAQLADVLVGEPAPELETFRVDRPALTSRESLIRSALSSSSERGSGPARKCTASRAETVAAPSLADANPLTWIEGVMHPYFASRPPLPSR